VLCGHFSFGEKSANNFQTGENMVLGRGKGWWWFMVLMVPLRCAFSKRAALTGALHLSEQML
jgi:hypothetical protein